MAALLVAGCSASTQSHQSAQPQPSPEKAKRIEDLENKLAKVNEANAAIEDENQGLSEEASKLDKLVQRKNRRAKNRNPKLTYRISIEGAPSRGPADALVTIVLWGDLQSPFYKRVHPLLESALKRHGQDVRLVFKHNPLDFHRQAYAAAIAAEAAARQGKFWEMEKLMRENFKDLSEENFMRWAKELGLKLDDFRRDSKDPELRARIEEDLDRGADLGVRMAPTLSVNGRFFDSVPTSEDFESMIDEQLRAAKNLLKSGVKRELVYETIIDGKPSKL